MVIRYRRLVIWSALAAVFAAALWVDGFDQAIQSAYSERVEATPEQAAADRLSSQVRKWRGQLESRRFNSGTGGDAFPSMTWEQPKRAPAGAVRKGPVVPAFAYTYVGKLVPAGGNTILFLSRGESLNMLHEGDVVDGVFRIDAIREDRVELVHIATKTRLTKSYDELVAPSPAAQAGVTPGSPMTMAQATSPAAGNPPAARPEDRRAAEEKSESKPPATGIVGGRPVATANQPAASTASTPPSTPAAPSPPGSPMQLMPPGQPMEMTIPPPNTVPPQGLNPTYPANVVPPQGAGK